jgi:5-oxoprolinase (ATP-hydrolysing)
MNAKRGWQFWIDRGGTFTDIIGRAPDGRLIVDKRLSESAQGSVDPGIAGALAMLGRHDGPDAAIEVIRIGTTVATNALLERQGVPTALVTTAGLGDALAIGYQNRPHLFRLKIELPAPLYREVVEADERVTAEGEVLRALDEHRLAADLGRLRRAGIASVAIVFLHGYRHVQHEQQAAALARTMGFDEVIASHEASPLIRFVSRGDTTVVDAYLTPLLARYVRALRESLGRRHQEVRLEFMQSNGGLVAPEAFRACNAVLSGPAGGLVATARIAERLDRPKLIAFDMGGTSTDVALYDGALPQRFETLVAGVRLQAPMMNIHTVAAGGGSVLAFAGGRLQVGPQSAGSFPGPACYRNGGPLTVTDLQVLLGRIRPAEFPALFGAEGDQPLDAAVVQRRFDELASEVSVVTGARTDCERLASGFLDVAIESMARAIRHVSVRQGHDPAEFALCCYGGAAPQHACRVADALGISQILIHPLAGVLSAWGIGLADRRLMRRKSIEQPLAVWTAAGLEAEFAAMTGPLADTLAAQETPASAVRLRRVLELRAPGTETALEVEFAAPRSGTSARIRAALRFLRPRRSRRRDAPPRRGCGRKAGAGAPSGNPPRRRAPVDGWRTPLDACSARQATGPVTHRRGELDDGGRAWLDCTPVAGWQPPPDPQRSQSGGARHGRAARSGAARALQSPFHAGGGADGRGAAGDGRLGQHPRAARLLLRAVRRSRGADRERAAHAGAPRLHGRERPRRGRRQRGRAAARPRLDAERALRGRHAPA